MIGLISFAQTKQSKTRKKKSGPDKDTAYLFALNWELYHKAYIPTKTEIEARQNYMRSNTYIGGSRSKFLGRYDGFFGGLQSNNTKISSNIFGEIGFVSNRLMRPTYAKTHLPDFLYITFAFNPAKDVYGLHFGAKQPLLRKEKNYNFYDILYVGGEIRLYNDGNVTRRSITPTVSFSPPFKYANNLLFTYGYDYFLNGKEISEINSRHLLTLHYIFPNF
jgi:hypothetical protein